MFTFTQFVVSAQSVVEYEIVPFDYTDEDMRELLCYMVDKDAELAQVLNFTQENSMREYLSKPDEEYGTALLVCRSTNGLSTVYGFIMWSMHDTFMQFRSVGVINALAVAKQYRGKGIAQALLNSFEHMCRDNGFESLLLYVARNNDKAIRSYQWNGFSVIDDAIDEANHEIPMMKSLC